MSAGTMTQDAAERAPATLGTDLPAEERAPAKAAETRDVTVVVPCYNEEGAIEDTLDSLETVLAGAGDYEIVVVDDGSTDGTRAILDRVSAERARVRVVRHGKNGGYGSALKTGFRAARAPLVAITDADGTYPIERLPSLIALMPGHDMVVGARTGANVTYSKLRAFPKIFLRAWSSWITGYNIPDINSGMRVFRRDTTMRFLPLLPDGFSFTTTVSICMLTNYCNVHYEPIDYVARIGKSKIKPIQDTMNFFTLILRTGMYFAPLRVLTPLIGVSFVGMVLSLMVDLFAGNLTDKTVILFALTLNVGLFALLADMINKRMAR